MMHSKNVVVVIVALVALMLGGFVVNTASAADIQVSDNLNNGINLPGFDFGFSTTNYDGGSTNFSTYLVSVDRITNASIRFGVNSSDPATGWVHAYFIGIVDEPAVAMETMRQTMDMSRRGVELYSSASISSQKDILGWAPSEEGESWEPVYGGWLSSSNLDATLSNVTPTSARSYYNEWLDNYSDLTWFSVGVDWNFLSDINGPAFSATTSVPEPATMGLLALGGIGLLARRRRNRG